MNQKLFAQLSPIFNLFKSTASSSSLLIRLLEMIHVIILVYFRKLMLTHLLAIHAGLDQRRGVPWLLEGSLLAVGAGALMDGVAHPLSPPHEVEQPS